MPAFMMLRALLYGALLGATATGASREAAPTAGPADVLKGYIEGKVEAQRERVRSATPISAQTAYGPIVGLDDGKVVHYLGVPFAAAPVGPLRWAPPQPPSPWSAPLNTTWWGPVCPQDPEFFFWGLFSGMSEDCLSLNIYAPSPALNKTAPAGGWPIMIWSFGGGWLMGAGGFVSYMGYFPEAVVEDVIIVTFNYRVSLFGFLAGDPLRADSTDGSVGNYGLQDMRAALDFVILSAAAFGGNPDLVTVYGESAGGASISNMLVSPRFWGKFQRAIMESGPIAASWPIAFNYSTAAAFYPQLANATGCPLTGAASLACLRALSWQNLTTTDMLAFYSMHHWGPVIDGVEVPDAPWALAAAGKLAPGVPVLLGTNADEGSMFALVDVPTNLTAAAYPAALAAQWGPKLGPLAEQAFPLASFASPFQAFVRALGDFMMTCPARSTARWLTSPRRNGNAGNNASVYQYLYTHNNAMMALMSDVMGMPLGVCHAAELFNVWVTEPMLVGPGEMDLAKLFVRYWTRFAATGNPNGGGDPVWLAYGQGTGGSGDSLAILDISAGGAINVTNALGVRGNECDFWDQYVPE